MTAKNSSFSKAGVEQINQSRTARLDLSSGELSKADLGVAEGEILWDVNVAPDRSIALTVVGSSGQLEAQTNTIRVLADPNGEIRTVSYFSAFASVQELSEKLRADAALAGLDSAELESFLTASSKDGEHQVSLNGGNALGFQLSINVTIDHSKPGQVLQYVVTPAKVAARYK